MSTSGVTMSKCCNTAWETVLEGCYTSLLSCNMMNCWKLSTVGAYQKEFRPLLNRNTKQKKSVGQMMQMHIWFFSCSTLKHFFLSSRCTLQEHFVSFQQHNASNWASNHIYTVEAISALFSKSTIIRQVYLVAPSLEHEDQSEAVIKLPRTRGLASITSWREELISGNSTTRSLQRLPDMVWLIYTEYDYL
jgi:hypothetical protein